MDDEMSIFEFSSAASEHLLIEKLLLGILFLDHSFETINGFTTSHTSSLTPADDKPDYGLMQTIE